MSTAKGASGAADGAPQHRSAEMERRLFLRRLGVAAGAVALAGAGYGIDDLLTSGGGTKAAGGGAGAGRSHPTSTTAPRVTTTTVPSGELPNLPTAGWVAEENSRPGTTNWTHVGTAYQGQLEGFADRTSAVAGDEVTLYVNTVSPTVKVEIYRMGWYGGLGGRLVATTPTERGIRQAQPEFTSAVNMVECHWKPAITFRVEADWPPGNYLLRLVGTDEAEWVPLTIRDDASTAAIVFQNSVTTWQAYNLWGGYSLYYGAMPGGGQSYDTRSRIVSFDRPYTYHWAAGVADWLGNEFPLLRLAERYGLDLAYWTDVDLHEHPERLLSHRALLSLGHDEYWSAEMRAGALSALTEGVNFAFLGANACYRHIRFDASPLGSSRRQVCYKDGTEDPLNGVDNSAVTWNWEDGPDPRPESDLIGDMYQSYLGSGPMVVADPQGWVFKGTDVGKGARFADVIGSEFDGFAPALPGPRNLDILCHSATSSVSGQGFSDMTWYTATGGGGVYASGTASYISKLWDNTGPLTASWALRPISGVTEPLTQITLNVLAVLGEEPASRSFPSSGNWQSVYNESYAGVSSSDV
jgi:hypothetical protein